MTKGQDQKQEQYWWVVLWVADDGQHAIDLQWSESKALAVEQVRQWHELGMLSCTSDQLTAVPAGADYNSAVLKYRAYST